MFKYIVTWLIVNTYITPCEQPKPYEDEYGRTHYPNMQLAVICYKSDSTLKSKEFVSKKEAVEFIKKGQPDSVLSVFGSIWPPSSNAVLLNFKLDSIKIKN